MSNTEHTQQAADKNTNIGATFNQRSPEAYSRILDALDLASIAATVRAASTKSTKGFFPNKEAEFRCDARLANMQRGSEATSTPRVQ